MHARRVESERPRQRRAIDVNVNLIFEPHNMLNFMIVTCSATASIVQLWDEILIFCVTLQHNTLT